MQSLRHRGLASRYATWISAIRLERLLCWFVTRTDGTEIGYVRLWSDERATVDAMRRRTMVLAFTVQLPERAEVPGSAEVCHYTLF